MTTTLKQPTISVVIPTFNYGHFIGEALTSALRQNFAPLEIIVVDDGSTDGTEAALRPYAERIVYIRQDNAGVSAARNRGIRAARGDWIAMLDADDIWLPNKLESQRRCAAAHPDAVLIGGLNTAARKQPASGLYSVFSVEDFLKALPFGTSSALARRECLLENGLFNEARRLAEDRELWLKLTRRAPAARVNAAVWTYRHHAGQSINQARRMAESYRAVLCDFFALNPEFTAEREAAHAYFHYDSAMAFHETGARLNALRHVVASFFVHPSPLRFHDAEAHFDRRTLLLKTVIGEPAFRALRGMLRRKPSQIPTVADVP